jgi:hypothetical protein
MSKVFFEAYPVAAFLRFTFSNEMLYSGLASVPCSTIAAAVAVIEVYVLNEQVTCHLGINAVVVYQFGVIASTFQCLALLMQRY